MSYRNKRFILPSPRHILACLLALVLSFLSFSIVSAEVVTAEDYWLLVAESQQQLSDEEITAAQLRALSDRWEAVTAVHLGGDRVMTIDTTPIVNALRADNANTAALAEQFTAVLRTRAVWPDEKWDAATAAAATAELETILQRAEFQEAQPSFVEELWNSFWERVDEIVTRFLPEGGGEGLLGLDTFGLVIAILAGLILLAVIALIVRNLVSDFVTEAEFAAERQTNGEPLTSARALEQAQKLSDAGDFRTAVRYLYLSCLLSLEERNLLRYDRSLTNREYLRSVAHRPELFTLLRDVVDVFDRVWYGFMPIDEETYQQYAVRVQTLQRQRPSPRSE